VESPWEDNGVIHHGSAFHFNVVFESAPELPPAAEAIPAPEPAVADNGGRRILLAEDNEINRKLACRLLERQKYQVLTAINGWEAVALW